MRLDVAAVRRAVEAMNPSLRHRFEVIRQTLTNDREHPLVSRREVGAMIAELKNDPDKYGMRAVGLVAAALKRDETVLYRYAQVAARWSRDEIARIAARRNRDGAALSWSHLVELSTVGARRDREALVERALDEGLSVREVARLATKAHRAGAATFVTRRLGRVERRLAELARLGAAGTEIVAELEELSRLVTLPRDAERLEVVIGRARALHAEIAEQCTRAIERLVRLAR